MRVDPKSLVRRLTPTATRMLEAAVGRAAGSQHRDVTVEHVLHQMLAPEDGDAAALLQHAGQDRVALLGRVEKALNHMPNGSSARPVFSPTLFKWFEDAWLMASLEHGETSLRSGILLYRLIDEPDRYCGESFPELEAIDAGQMAGELETALTGLPEDREARPPGGGEGATAERARGLPGAASGEGALGRFCRNFTEDARSGRIDPIFGRHREIRQMIDIFSRRRKNNPIIVGEPGVGKTALVEGMAHLIVEGEVPKDMRTCEILGLDMGLLQAGASVKGEFENRLKAVISEVKASEKPIILFIDEAHTLIGAGGSQGGNDAANLLKPALARGELRTVAATTWAEYKKYFEKDAALERRFQPVKVAEPDEDGAKTMLRGIREIYEKAHGVRILDEAIVAAVELSHRYISGRQLPDKAVDLLDTSAARVRVERDLRPEELVDLDEERKALLRQRASMQRDLEDGHEGLRDAVEELEARIEELTTRRDALEARWEEERAEIAEIEGGESGSDDSSEAHEDEGADERGANPDESAAAGDEGREPGAREHLVHRYVDADAVARTVSAWTGIPLGKMKRDSMGAVLELESRLEERVIGQDPAVSAVAEALRIAYAGVRNPDTPIGVMLFVGPSGVGKTETAIALSDMLYGGDRFLTTINMTEFMEKHTVSRLIGSPPGYVGYGEGGLLTEAVRQKPYSVVLLDECEKADPEVLNLFYQVFDKGVLNDGEGRPIDFKNTMIILTSNLATDAIMEAYANADAPPSTDEVVSAIRPILSAHFKPALLARMTIVPYRPIDPESMKAIAELKLSKLARRIERSHGFVPTFSEELLTELAKRCTEAETGARNIDHILRGSLTPLIAKELLGAMSEGEVPVGLEAGLSPDGSFRIDLDVE